MRKNQKGFTILEITIALGLLVFGSLTIGKIYVDIRKQVNNAAVRFGKKLQVRNIAVSIASNLPNYQINYAGQGTQSSACSYLAAGAGMPLRWNRSEVVSFSECNGNSAHPCPEGQAGYIIEPFPNSSMRGLYLVTVRMYHPELTKGQTGVFCNGADSEEYQFVLGLR